MPVVYLRSRDAGRTVSGTVALVGRGARGEGRPSLVPGPFDAGLERSGFEMWEKGAIFGSGVGTSLSARPHFLEPELDSDTH